MGMVRKKRKESALGSVFMLHLGYMMCHFEGLSTLQHQCNLPAQALQPTLGPNGFSHLYRAWVQKKTHPAVQSAATCLGAELLRNKRLMNSSTDEERRHRSVLFRHRPVVPACIDNCCMEFRKPSPSTGLSERTII